MPFLQMRPGCATIWDAEPSADAERLEKRQDADQQTAVNDDKYFDTHRSGRLAIPSVFSAIRVENTGLSDRTGGQAAPVEGAPAWS
jgi:hypothetical protein